MPSSGLEPRKWLLERRWFQLGNEKELDRCHLIVINGVADIDGFKLIFGEVVVSVSWIKRPDPSALMVRPGSLRQAIRDRYEASTSEVAVH